MKKRITATIIFAAMVISLIVPIGAAGTVTEKKSFLDVRRGDWYYDDVILAAERGIISGYEDGTFKPNNNITVEEYAAMVIRVCGIALEKTVGVKHHWAEEYIRTAEKHNIIQAIEITEIEKTTIKSDITKQMAVTALMRGVTNKNSVCYDPAKKRKEGITQKDLKEDFTDYTEIKGVHIRHAKFAKDYGYVLGDEKGAFRPLSTLSRAEAAALMNRAYTEPVEPVPPQEVPEEKVKLAQLLLNTGNYAEKTYPTPLYYVNKDGTKEGINYREMTFDKESDINGNTSLIIHLLEGGYKPGALAEVLKIFKIAFPTQYKAAYNALMAVMREEIFEYKLYIMGASAVRYYDNRMLTIQFHPTNTLYTEILISDIMTKEDTKFDEWTAPNPGYDAPIHTMTTTKFEDGKTFRENMFTVTNTPDRFIDLP